MKAYRTLKIYAVAKGIHYQTALKRNDKNRVTEVIIDWKRVWYIDKLDVTQDFINNL